MRDGHGCAVALALSTPQLSSFNPRPSNPTSLLTLHDVEGGFGGDGHVRGKHGGLCGCNVQGQVVDPVTEAPPAVRRQQKPDSLCVMFFGGPADKVRPCRTRPPALSSRPFSKPLCVHTAALARLRSTADKPAVVAAVLAVPGSMPSAGIPVDISRCGFIRHANCPHCEPVGSTSCVQWFCGVAPCAGANRAVADVMVHSVESAYPSQHVGVACVLWIEATSHPSRPSHSLHSFGS